MFAAAATTAAAKAVGIGVVAFLTAPAAPKPARALLIRFVAAAGLGPAAAEGGGAVGDAVAADASLMGTESGNEQDGSIDQMSS